MRAVVVGVSLLLLALVLPTASAEVGISFFGFGPCVDVDIDEDGVHQSTSGWVGCGWCIAGPECTGGGLDLNGGVGAPGPFRTGILPDEYQWVSDPITGTCVGVGTREDAFIADVDFTGECGTVSICKRFHIHPCEDDFWPPEVPVVIVPVLP